MYRRVLQIFALMLLVAVFAGAGHGEDPPAGLMELDGSVADWHSYLRLNKWLLVNIWNADCPVCNETVHEIVTLHARRGGDDLFILGIALVEPGGRAGVDAYIDRHRINFYNLLDDGANVGQIYRDATGSQWGGWTPTFLLYNPRGKLVAQNIGPVRASDIIEFIDNYSGQ